MGVRVDLGEVEAEGVDRPATSILGRNSLPTPRRKITGRLFPVGKLKGARAPACPAQGRHSAGLKRMILVPVCCHQRGRRAGWLRVWSRTPGSHGSPAGQVTLGDKGDLG